MCVCVAVRESCGVACEPEHDIHQQSHITHVRYGSWRSHARAPRRRRRRAGAPSSRHAGFGPETLANLVPVIFGRKIDDPKQTRLLVGDELVRARAETHERQVVAGWNENVLGARRIAPVEARNREAPFAFRPFGASRPRHAARRNAARAAIAAVTWRTCFVSQPSSDSCSMVSDSRAGRRSAKATTDHPNAAKRPAQQPVRCIMRAKLDALATVEAQLVCERIGKVARISEREAVGGIGLWRKISDCLERREDMGSHHLCRNAAGAPVWADTPDISARRLLSGWRAEDPNMRMLAEVIASAFASGPPGLRRMEEGRSTVPRPV